MGILFIGKGCWAIILLATCILNTVRQESPPLSNTSKGFQNRLQVINFFVLPNQMAVAGILREQRRRKRVRVIRKEGRTYDIQIDGY